MDLDKYKELTGSTVSPSQEAKVKATIRRTKAALEDMLGFSLKPKNIYIEKGKTPVEGAFPTADLTLLDPDEEEGVYKLFPYNETDKNFHVDPYINVYKVKLVIPTSDGEFITVKDLDDFVPQYGRNGVGKYIQRQDEWFWWPWYATWREFFFTSSSIYPNGLQLAVEADWIDCYPDDLLYLWADMVDYYSNPNYNVMGSLKSESVDGHSWSRGNAGGGSSGDTAPEGTTANVALLARYAGPFGKVTRNPVR